MWLVRYNDLRGKLNRVGLDIVSSLLDVAGWQVLNLAGPTEDRIERFVSRLLDETFPLDAILPGRAWSSNERERVPRNPRPPHRWGQSRPTIAVENTKSICFVRTVGHF